ncbi:MAG: hypothetical protein K2F59_03130, partial [Eubacteriales bacterium]|nr:hypothetical protein [Eubacteriales bacterium]
IYLFSFFNTIYLRNQILNGVYFDDSLKSVLKIIKSIVSNNKAKKETIIDKRIKKSEMEN